MPSLQNVKVPGNVHPPGQGPSSPPPPDPVTVTTAAPTDWGFATLVAVTLNVPGVPFEVKSPVAVMVPPPFTTQFTSWLNESSTTRP